MRAAGSPELDRRLDLIDARTSFQWDELQPDFRISTKLRTIDPDVWLDGELRPLSAVDPEFGRRRDHYLASKRGKWPIRVFGPPAATE
jgi:hypothetical protein